MAEFCKEETSVEIEVDAMEKIMQQFDRLDFNATGRVLRWLTEVLDEKTRRALHEKDVEVIDG